MKAELYAHWMIRVYCRWQAAQTQEGTGMGLHFEFSCLDCKDDPERFFARKQAWA